MKTLVRTICVFVVVSLCTGCKTTGSTSASGSSRLSRQMIGTWAFAGTPGHLEPVPEKGVRYKHRTGTHWIISQANGETGLVHEVFGGSYQMNGDTYVETQHFANETWLHDNGKSWKFRVTIDGDTMTQYGIDNQYTEVWKRVR